MERIDSHRMKNGAGRAKPAQAPYGVFRTGAAGADQ
jgi:hypothetical protein